jgi:hypothetical protein
LKFGFNESLAAHRSNCATFSFAKKDRLYIVMLSEGRECGRSRSICGRFFNRRRMPLPLGIADAAPSPHIPDVPEFHLKKTAAQFADNYPSSAHNH